MTDFLAIVGLMVLTACSLIIFYVLVISCGKMLGVIKEYDIEDIEEPTYWSRKLCGNCTYECNKKTREINNADGECLCYEDGDHIKELKNKING
jgi:hypothetical protein